MRLNQHLLQRRSLVFAAPFTASELLVRDLIAKFSEVGLNFYLPHFPFAYHHDFYRQKLRYLNRHIKLNDVANLLLTWSKTRQQSDDYVYQAVCGAMHHKNISLESSQKIPSDIYTRLTELDSGRYFLSYAKDVLKRQHR